MVAVPRRASPVRSQVLVVRRRRRAARVDARVILGTPGIRRRSRLRPDRDGAHRDAESSVSAEQGSVGKAIAASTQDRRPTARSRARETSRGVLRRADATWRAFEDGVPTSCASRLGGRLFSAAQSNERHAGGLNSSRRRLRVGIVAGARTRRLSASLRTANVCRLLIVDQHERLTSQWATRSSAYTDAPPRANLARC